MKEPGRLSWRSALAGARQNTWPLVAVLLAVTLAALSVPLCVAADLGGGANAVQFLRDGIGAAGRAMGGAWTALASGSTAAFWNPAPAIQTPSMVVGGAYEERSGGLFTLNYLGGAVTAKEWGISALTVQSEMYDVYLLAGGLVSGSFSLGIGANAYVFGVPDQRGVGLGLDVGCRYGAQIGRTELIVALASKDVGWTNIVWRVLDVEETDFAAWVTRAAFAVSSPLGEGRWTVEVDAELAFDRPPVEGEVDYWDKAVEASVCAGIQGTWRSLRGRLGLQSLTLPLAEARVRATFGVGLTYSNLSIDLTLIPSALGFTYLGEFNVDF
jgi:hypothetical protein